MAVNPRVASWLQATPFALVMIFLVIVPLGIIFVVSFLDYGFAEIIPEILWDNYLDIFRSQITIDLYVTVFRLVAGSSVRQDTTTRPLADEPAPSMDV